jgi:hypothetical protein
VTEEERFVKWKVKNKLFYYWGKSGVFFRELLWPCWKAAVEPYDNALEKLDEYKKALLKCQFVCGRDRMPESALKLIKEIEKENEKKI